MEIDISKISADPKQPRKSFSEDNLKPLANSIKEMGLIQPITVRKSDNKYIIVVGERRFRACKLIGLKTIECIVKEYDVNSISTIQIIENLQREQVPPIEEAECIAKLLETLNAKDISHSIGRSENFVRRRATLSNLIPSFKSYVNSNELNLDRAMVLASSPTEDQEDIFQGMITQCNGFNLHYINRACNEKSTDLSKAPFDLKDTELLITAGACNVCPFNSINQGNLFGKNKPVCSKPTCFETKKFKVFNNLLLETKETKTTIFLDVALWNVKSDENQLLISTMENNGFEVYLPDDADILKLPIKPTMEQLKRENSGYELSEQELKKELAEELKEYKQELHAYKACKSNGFTKGLLFNTKSYTTDEIMYKLDEEEAETEETKLSIPLNKKTMEQCTPEEKIQKINDKEERKKWIENNKQFEEVANIVRETNYINLKKALTQDEIIAFTLIITEDFLGHWQSKERENILGKISKSSKKNKREILADFNKSFSKEAFNKAIRTMILKQCHYGEENQVNNLVNAAIYKVMKTTYKQKVESIEKVYEQQRVERETKISSKIKEIKATTKALAV